MTAVDVYQHILEAVDFYNYLGLTFVDAGSEERQQMQMPEAAALRTPVGHVHGGVLASLIDVAGLYAVWQEYGTPGAKAYTTAMEVSFEESTAQGVAARTTIRGRDGAGGRDELDIEVELYELPDAHEFGTPYVPEHDPERTLVATSRLEFVVLESAAAGGA